jgi:hypothetical protein
MSLFELKMPWAFKREGGGCRFKLGSEGLLGIERHQLKKPIPFI